MLDGLILHTDSTMHQECLEMQHDWPTQKCTDSPKETLGKNILNGV